MNELKPCPFCNREAEITQCQYNDYYVTCKNCGCQLGQDGVAYNDFGTKEEAIKAWNTRTDVSIGMSREEAKKKEWAFTGAENTDKMASMIIDKLYDSIEGGKK